MKKTIAITLALLMAGNMAFAGSDNTLSKEEKAAGWQLLWDGKSLDGWKAALNKKDATKGWYVSDGELRTVKYNGDNATVVDIRTDRKYTNFILTLQVKITPGANSGVKYFIQDNMNVGCEFLILDNEQHPDATNGICGNRNFGSLYDLIPADPEKSHYCVGDWNDVKIVVDGNHVQHWLNGALVVDYYRNNQMFNALVNTSKFAGKKGFGNYDSGYILLQNHKDEIAYKNIKIREL